MLFVFVIDRAVLTPEGRGGGEVPAISVYHDTHS